MSETRVAVLVGSLREGSVNRRLAHRLLDLAPAGLHLEIVGGLDAVPFYNEDLDAGDPPAAAARLRDAVAAADRILVVTPEYNGTIPAVLKNAIDWLSRPPGDIKRVFGDRAVAVMGASPGAAGTAMAQAAWLPVLRTLGTRPWFGARMQVGGASKVFDDAGRLVDDKVRGQLREFVEGFARFAARGG